MQLTATPALYAYEIQIYEVAEHWNFYQTFEATSHAAAIAMARKAYGKGYVVRG
jgi:hypothetical protein